MLEQASEKTCGPEGRGVNDGAGFMVGLVTLQETHTGAGEEC